LPLATGDDYELCITLSPAAAEALRRGWPEELAPLSIIGEVRAAPGIECRLPDGRRMIPDIAGHDHFS
jgi:thiamine-monophosphate kinase